MSNESRPTTGPKALGSEALKGIVGGTNGDDRQTVDAQTAIALTAGVGEAPTAPGPIVSEGASGPQAKAMAAEDHELHSRIHI
jgi:hypothetical protein